MTLLNIIALTAATVAAVLYIFMAAVTSWHISKSEYFGSGQKLAQHAIVWLIPFIGAAFVLHMLSPDTKQKGPGWVPWCELLILSAFVSSATAASDSAASSSDVSSDTNTPSGGCSND